jgi:hypothetical protein
MNDNKKMTQQEKLHIRKFFRDLAVDEWDVSAAQENLCGLFASEFAAESGNLESWNEDGYTYENTMYLLQGEYEEEARQILVSEINRASWVVEREDYSYELRHEAFARGGHVGLAEFDGMSCEPECFACEDEGCHRCD